MRRSVVEQASEVRTTIGERLREVLKYTDVNLTTDLWTGLNGCQFITLTVHWIDKEWNFHTKILGTHRTYGL